MLDSSGFDLWADGYDNCVGISDGEDSYPFAGYKQMLNTIYNRVLTGRHDRILDLGFGTGTLSGKLYERGCCIWGQDFSERMIELARKKMPEAELYQGDLAGGLVEELKKERYDVIIATYSLHHLSDEKKIRLIGEVLPLLQEGGRLYIGDVAFESRSELERCRIAAGEEWDDDEIYFVADEFRKSFPQMKYEKFSFCAGLLSFERDVMA